jgi:hypothetical protein
MLSARRYVHVEAAEEVVVRAGQAELVHRSSRSTSALNEYYNAQMY